MKKIRETFRLHLECGLSGRQIARALEISNSTACHYINALKKSGLTWSSIAGLSDDELEQLVNPHCAQIKKVRRQAVEIDYANVHQELKKKGVTRELLWEEYRDGSSLPIISYSQFCYYYRQFLKKQKPSMRHTHKAAEKTFVDYAGPTVPIHDAVTGDIHQAKIFVGILGASNYTYAEATLTRSIPDWIGSHVRMFEFFGGVTELIIPDNEKSGVNKACRYDPDLNPQYAALAVHYNTVVLPTRPAKPKDKAKVEAAVLLVERWILARLRHRTFFSLDELNREISQLLVKLNERPFKKLPGSRASQFEALDKPALKPLPSCRYEYVDIQRCQVRLDYHIEVDNHFYSVPHRFIRQPVEYQLGAKTVSVFADGNRIASHIRSYEKGKHTTDPEHMPQAHRHYQEWTPQKFVDWANDIGENTSAVVSQIIEQRSHPECCHRIHDGFVNLLKRYGKTRLEEACCYADQKKLYSHRHVHSILKTQVDKAPISATNETEFNEATDTHQNVRGGLYYLTTTNKR